MRAPTRARRYDSLALLSGDVVVVATDGLSDSLYPVEMLHLVARALGREMSAAEIADELVEAAVECSSDPHRISPIVDALAKQGLVARSREAQDDVTVLVARVL